MQTIRVGVRELKSGLSEYLRQVKSGKIVIVTEHGKPIGQIVPIISTLEEKMRSLVQTGFIVQFGTKLPPPEPSIVNKGERLISDLVSENRDVDYLP
jgi:prevent-host-death family protein